MTGSSSLGGDVFTFDTPEAVLRVLASIRASDATIEQKNELRDLVLSYTNGGKDPSVQIQISQQLQNLGVALVPAVVKNNTLIVKHDFGSTRNVPMFHTAKLVQTPSVTTPTPVDSQPPASRQVATQASPVAEAAAPATVPDPLPAAVKDELPVPPVAPASETITPQVSQTSADEVIPSQPQVVDVADESSSAPQEDQVVELATPPPAPQLEKALARIREIKSLVNEQVGNPVNLVDIDNTVGREYMSSLLNAMKQLNSGSGSEAAMTRLETAYQAVEELLKSKKNSSVTPDVTPVPVKPADVPKPAPPAPTSLPVARPVEFDTKDNSQSGELEVSNQPKPQRTEAVNNSVTQERQESTQRPIVESATTDKVDSRWENSEFKVPPTPPTPPAPQKPVPDVTPIKNSDSVTEASKPLAVPKSIRSLADSSVPLKTIADVPTAASVNTSATGDPLFTKEVTDGLNQLLAEWTLFKKSGLFGTGPNGISHPLYIKIKDLQVPLLLAGRFEGATQEIKQSVTDYMNGWRYEQGIIYEQGETFDHYLRRVIRHILDLQN